MKLFSENIAKQWATIICKQHGLKALIVNRGSSMNYVTADKGGVSPKDYSITYGWSGKMCGVGVPDIV